MEVEQLEHGLWREHVVAVVALEEDDVVPHVVGEVAALPLLVDDEGGVPRQPQLLGVRLELEINKADAAEGAEEERGNDHLQGVRRDRRPQSGEDNK